MRLLLTSSRREPEPGGPVGIWTSRGWRLVSTSSDDAEYEAVLAWKEARTQAVESDEAPREPIYPSGASSSQVAEARPYRRLTCATRSPFLLQDRRAQCRVCSRLWNRSLPAWTH